MSVEFELPVSKDVLRLLFGGDLPDEPPKFQAEFSFRRPGKAGLTSTQMLLALNAGPRVPIWIWKMRARRTCWRNGSQHEVLVPSAAFEAAEKKYREQIAQVEENEKETAVYLRSRGVF